MGRLDQVNGLHDITTVRLTPEEIDFLNILARRISNEVYGYQPKYLSYDDSDRLRLITKRAPQPDNPR